MSWTAPCKAGQESCKPLCDPALNSTCYNSQFLSKRHHQINFLNIV